MPWIRHPDGGQLAGPVQPGQGEGIAPVGLDAFARTLGDQRRSDDRALMPESGDLALQAIAGRTGLVAEQHLAVPARQLVDQAPHRLGRVVDLAEEADFALAAVFGHGDGDLSLEVSRPTNTLLFCCMARPLCGRLGAGRSGATLAHRIVWTSHLRRQRTYGLVHAQQFTSRAHEHVQCPGALEADAYGTQALYLSTWGLREEAFLLQILGMFQSACGYSD